MRSAELATAALALDEVESELQEETERRGAEAWRGRSALVQGDRVEWAIAETTGEYAETRIGQLAELKGARLDRFEAAADAHRGSWLRVEQMKSVLEQSGRAEMTEEARRTQAAADDRFAGQAWMRGRGRRGKA